MALTYIQVGSWNIKHLGRQPGPKDREQSVFALTDHIEMSGIDVLALQEVYITDERDFSNKHLDLTCKYLKEHTECEWKYRLFPNRDEEDTSQLCGFLWNDSLIELEDHIPIPVPTNIGRDWIWDRKPHAVKFRSKHKILGDHRSFVAVALHMKANGRDKRARLKRELEAKELVKHIPMIVDKMKDDSIILLGDTNILGSWEKAAETIVNAGFDDLNDEDSPTYAGGNAPFDRIFLKDDRKEFRYSRQYIMRSANESAHLEYLSDHYMVKTSIKISVDE